MTQLIWVWLVTGFIFVSPILQAQESTPLRAVRLKVGDGVPFPLEKLSRVPEVFPTDVASADGVKSFFYAGVPYKGRPTRVYAYYGVPRAAGDKTDGNQKYPAMVLIHGGGGTAFERWVKLWNERGYAAIAMDVCGCVPVGTYGKWQRHEDGGPPGWDASFGQLEDPIEDQWAYHAVSAAALAHTLVRSYPEVDPDRIGVTGISWGGYLTCIVSGVDSRFQFAAPVYGCGFLGDNSVWIPALEKLGSEKSALWLNQWDPSSYLMHTRMPVLWVNGTNDFAYPMNSWQKSYRIPESPRTLCLRVRMPHGHGPAGENPAEIQVYANAVLKKERPLPEITEQGQTGEEAWAKFTASVPIESAELAWTRDTGKWQDRKWEQLPASVDPVAGRVSAKIPVEARVFYLNLYDNRKCAVSSQHVER
ncbi:MAG: acetylxylan esterase [Planctomycetes bacterium]|nr:acetylxylan esterase [Planctomycetota bacterium]